MAVDKKTLKCNKPRKTPSHNTKSHVVKACENGKEKIIRFGQQGVTTAGKKTDAKSKARRASFKARHAKNIKKGKMSAAYWADKVKW
jgi:20S proteasome alpha/beta subunit|eukprot:COSAG01_NODE_15159_length_1367_cov_1.089905_3_plen_87_part_00